MADLYTATATATGDGRNGHTRTSDGLVDLELAVPKELGGAGGSRVVGVSGTAPPRSGAT